MEKVVMVGGAAGKCARRVAGIFGLGCIVSSALLLPANADTTGGEKIYSAMNSYYQEIAVPIADCAEPDQIILSAIVPVATDHGSHASGIIYENNRVLTAAHALRGGGYFFVKVKEKYFPAMLLMVDHQHDLAVLEVDTALIKPQQFSVLNAANAEKVWAAGYPRAQSMSMSTGFLQGLHNGVLHTSATIDSGQSGGGLLSCSDGRWSLVGMLRGFGAYVRDGKYVKLQNHSVSVSSSTIVEFLYPE